MLGFVILPLIWSVPEAMVTAELTTAFPENSGYVAWVTAAFGPYWGFMVRTLAAWLLRCVACGVWACSSGWSRVARLSSAHVPHVPARHAAELTEECAAWHITFSCRLVLV